MASAQSRAPDVLERDDVLAAFCDALEGASRGRGSVLLVEGDAGLGKTTVLRAGIALAREQGAAVVAAGGGELEQSMPWAVARALLRDRAATTPELVGPVAGAVLGLGGGAVSDDVAALFELAELALALAARGPLVLAVDDVHWVDRSSARLLALLAPRAADAGLVLLLAARPADPRRPPELETLRAHDAVTTLPVAPLTPGACAAVVSRRVAGAAPDVIDACHRASGGNPFLLAELARELDERGGDVTAAAVQELEVAGVDRAVARRLAAAGPAAKELAQTAAVLGSGARLADAAAIAGLDYAGAARAADALRGAGVLARAAEADEGLRFEHPLLLAAVRRGVAPGARSLLHHASARRLDAAGAALDRVGAHLLAAEPGDDPWVRERLVAAADLALASGAPAAAIALLQRAIAERAGGTDPALLMRLGSAALPVDPQLAEGPLRAALHATPAPADRVAPALTLAIVLQMLRRPAEATQLLLGLDAELAGAGEARALRLRVQSEALAQSFFDPRTRGLRRTLLPELTAQLDGSCDEELLVHAHRAVEAVDTGTAGEALTLADLAWAGGRLERVAGAPETPTVMWLPYLRMYADDPEWTAELMRAWLDQARERGSAVLATFAHALLAQVHHRTGALADATAAGGAAWELAQGFGPGFPGWWIALGALIQAYLATGDAAGAYALAADHGLLDGDPPETMLMPAPRVVRAEVLIASGERARGVEELRSAWDWIAAEGSPSPGGWWFPATLVDGLLALDRREEALAIARAWLERTAAFGARSTVGQAERAVGLALGGAEALAWLERGEATLASSPARTEHARALLELGAARRRLRDARGAREPLRRALDLATRCGAGPLAERARTELVAAGGRPRREALSGPEALTASERRVALLAAEGRTNREIANALFISRKTVERHLTNTYLKLGHNERGRLVELLG